MATLTDLTAALAEGRNLVLSRGQKVFLLARIEPNRQKNPAVIRNLDSGASYICAPEKLVLIGSVDASALPWAKGSTPGEAPRPSRSGLPMKLADGTVIEPSFHELDEAFRASRKLSA